MGDKRDREEDLKNLLTAMPDAHDIGNGSWADTFLSFSKLDPEPNRGHA